MGRKVHITSHIKQTFREAAILVIGVINSSKQVS
jgi:hypothetical protein